MKHIIALAAAVGLVAPVGLADAAQDRGSDFSAVIRYTENGVPHIRANSYTGVGFGDGTKHIAHGGSRRRHLGVAAGLGPEHRWDHHRWHRRNPSG